MLAKISEDYPKVKNIEKKEEVNALINFLISIVNIRISNDEEKSNLDRQMILVFDLIKSKFGNLTAPEIREAFKMYVSREFPELKVFRILDCVTVGEVLSAYIEFRNEKLNTYNQKKRVLLQTPEKSTKEEIEKIREEFLKMIFDEILEFQFSSDSWRLFQELEDLKRISASNQEKKELYKKHLRIYEIEQKAEIRSQRGQFSKSYLKELQDKITGKSAIESVSNKCRSILVCKYLENFTEDFETFKNSIV
jgi:hypothetical protein